MNLCIDVGNNCTKIGIFEKEQIIQYQTYAPLTVNDIEELFQTYAISNAIISDVSFYDENISLYLQQNTAMFIKLTHETKVPFKNLYKTPETLGRDRIALAAAGNLLYPNEATLLIDAGTCITYDFVNAHNEYLGGSITPGLTMRFKALHNFTAKLPLLKKDNIDYYIGKNTEQSIISGVVNGTVGEMNAFIEKYQAEFGNINVALTGGDTPFFETRLKYKIFAVPNLVLRGLNKILDYNGA